jgi:general secretion pathway protein D
MPLFALALLTFPAHAETQYAPQPALLTDVSATPGEAGETRILLSFSPQAPKFSILRNDTEQPAIAFALSSRGMSAKFPSDLRGLLRAISVDQEDTVLILNLAVSAKTHLSATPMSDKVIALTVGPEPAPGAAAKTSTASAAPLPHAALRPPGEDGFEVVPLKYADVSEVVGLLTEGASVDSNDSFTPREPAFGSASVNGSSAFNPPPPQNAEAGNRPLAQSVDDSIAIDRRLNAIILKGSPALIARLKEKIAEIDVPVESVILETIFVELTEAGAKNVGLDFANANSQLAVGTVQTGAFIPFGQQTTGNQRTLLSGQLQAAIYAQVQNGHGRIVSKPRIAAQSGSSAKIITGDALPILTAITLSGVNGVSQQVQYVNVGVTLQIAPRVTEDDFVTSHVFCVVSSVTGFSQGYPTISQREAQTSATVRDGETFVIGGLTQENEIANNTKVPLLGDVPVLGTLFGLDKGTQSKTDLYIVITPHIVRKGASTAGVTLPPEAQPPAAKP